MPDPILTPPVPLVPPAAPWFEGKADPETVGYITNKGWHDKSAQDAALEIVKSYREAEKFIGAPANEVIRVPKDAKDEAGWKTLWGRLGAPADPKEYDFTGIKHADNSVLDQPFQDFLRAQATALHLSKDAAAALATEFVKRADATTAEQAAAKAATLTTEKAALDKNWGVNREANLVAAKAAAKALGVEPETVALLEKEVGYSKVMEMFRQIGSKIGEDKFVSNPNGSPGVMSRDQAMAQRTSLTQDPAWSKRLMEGGAAERREFDNLSVIIAGGDDTEDSRRR